MMIYLDDESDSDYRCRHKFQFHSCISEEVSLSFTSPGCAYDPS